MSVLWILLLVVSIIALWHAMRFYSPGGTGVFIVRDDAEPLGCTVSSRPFTALAVMAGITGRGPDGGVTARCHPDQRGG
jgi:hypothetical protein